LRLIGHETLLVAVLLAIACGEYSEKRLNVMGCDVQKPLAAMGKRGTFWKRVFAYP